MLLYTNSDSGLLKASGTYFPLILETGGIFFSPSNKTSSVDCLATVSACHLQKCGILASNYQSISFLVLETDVYTMQKSHDEKKNLPV